MWRDRFRPPPAVGNGHPRKLTPIIAHRPRVAGHLHGGTPCRQTGVRLRIDRFTPQALPPGRWIRMRRPPPKKTTSPPRWNDDTFGSVLARPAVSTSMQTATRSWTRHAAHSLRRSRPPSRVPSLPGSTSFLPVSLRCIGQQPARFPQQAGATRTSPDRQAVSTECGSPYGSGQGEDSGSGPISDPSRTASSAGRFLRAGCRAAHRASARRVSALRASIPIARNLSTTLRH